MKESSYDRLSIKHYLGSDLSLLSSAAPKLVNH